MTKVLTVGAHAAMLALLAENASLEGGHDIMEATLTDSPEAPPLTAAEKQSATIANAEPEPPKSRQVRRQEARQHEKRLRRHMNEHVGGKNRKRTSVYG